MAAAQNKLPNRSGIVHGQATEVEKGFCLHIIASCRSLSPLYPSSDGFITAGSDCGHVALWWLEKQIQLLEVSSAPFAMVVRQTSPASDTL
jgi:hypothetical protein